MPGLVTVSFGRVNCANDHSEPARGMIDLNIANFDFVLVFRGEGGLHIGRASSAEPALCEAIFLQSLCFGIKFPRGLHIGQVRPNLPYVNSIFCITIFVC